MKTRKKTQTFGLVILLSLIVTTNRSQTPFVLSGNIDYVADTYINASSLKILPNTIITLKHGSSLIIVADTFVIGTNVQLNAKGDKGSDGPNGAGPDPEWFAHHGQWDYEVENAKKNGCIPSNKCKPGGVGGSGGKGGTVKVFLRAMSIIPPSAFTLVNATGGDGGAGGKGGAGRRLSCTDHVSHRWDCTGCGYASNGSSGIDGSFSFYITGPHGGTLLTMLNSLANPYPVSVNLLNNAQWNAAATLERSLHP